MTNKRMYLKAMGSQCYDFRGVTYPEVIKIDLAQIFREVSSNVRWENCLGQSNLPKVLCFDADDCTLRRLKEFGPFLSWLNLLPQEHWMYDHKEETAVLVGLRLYQAFIHDAHSFDEDQTELYILTAVVEHLSNECMGGKFWDFIDDEEIHALCEKINTGKWHPKGKEDE